MKILDFKPMKKRFIKWTAAIIPIGLAFVLTACPEDEEDKSITEKGRQASAEFCDCYKKNTRDECLNKLKDNYSYSVYMNKDFIKAFNEVNNCGINLQLIQEKSASKKNDLLLKTR